MPIEVRADTKIIDREEYHRIDYQMMGLAFEIHRKLGRLQEEAIYQNELAYRARMSGLSVAREVPIIVSHRSFRKIYYMDLLVDGCVDYETKAAKGRSPSYHAQVLNYLFLSGLSHGKVVNFRTSSVQHEYVTTSMGLSDRYRFHIDDDRYTDTHLQSRWLRSLLSDLITDWGMFLQSELYQKAIVHFGGGQAAMYRNIELKVGGRVLGLNLHLCLNRRMGLHVSAVRKNVPAYERHLQRFLDVTPFETMQWVNCEGVKLRLTTLYRSST